MKQALREMGGTLPELREEEALRGANGSKEFQEFDLDRAFDIVANVAVAVKATQQ